MSTYSCVNIFRLVVAFMLFSVVASALLVSAAHARGEPRAIVVAWDGAIPAVVSELLQRGELPNLQRLINSGAVSDDVRSVFPSKTAPAFASLWTGAPPRVTGISGNRVPREPRGQHTIMESASGFRGTPLRAEPIWAAALRAGKKVVMSHAPLGAEMSREAVKFRGYDEIVGRDGIVSARTAKPKPAANWRTLPPSATPPIEFSFAIGASRFVGLLIDDPEDPRSGYDTLLVSTTRDTRDVRASLKPAPAGVEGKRWWSNPIQIVSRNQRKSAVYLRLFDLKADGSEFLVYFTRPAALGASEEEWLADASAMARAFIGNGAFEFYAREVFGQTIPNGGDGTAESRYLETVLVAQQQLIELNRWAMEHFSWDLFLAYSPFPDEAEHVWRGYLDPALAGYRPDIAERLRPFMSAVYRSCDEFLGLFMSNRPANTVIALVSDHGLEGADKLIAINRALQRAGLLETDARGFVDLSRTKVIYPAMNNGYFLLNTTDRKGGIIAPAERALVVQQLRDLLLSLRDGDKPIIHRVYDSESDGVKLGIGGEGGGDVYLEPVSGYDFDVSWDAEVSSGELITSRPPIGTHGLSPDRPAMRTLMVLNGPGVTPGRRFHDARITDFAPTLAKLLRIPAPRHATGRTLEEVMDHRALTPPVDVD